MQKKLCRNKSNWGKRVGSNISSHNNNTHTKIDNETTTNTIEEEHAEAISLCIDTLFIYYLIQQISNQKQQHQKAELQCESTLISPLVESRGFTPIKKLIKDMTTHCIDNYDLCMEMYSNKVASSSIDQELSPMSRMNALDILSLLGQLDYDNDDETEEETKNDDNGNEEKSDYDPWASTIIII